ncbi:MAG TPA: SpoIIE family protein phosphatase [Terriglobales bacterium]|nr:SpoIIE family protein phosphatase [Terriglobales bacterium]
MGNTPLPFQMQRHILRLDEQDPCLFLHFFMVFVRDQERSLRFYIDQLGFRLMVDHRFPNGTRWVEVSPPDGSAHLGLALIGPEADPEKYLGQDTRIYFLTEDVYRKYEEWSNRGVRFSAPPTKPEWGGVFTRFEDPDGNSFGLAGFDELTRSVEAQREALVKKYEGDRRTAQEMEIAKQVQARLFPQTHPEARTLEYSGLCLQASQVGGDYFDFLDLGQQTFGLVIGDVSGKGIAAALLMANLQANFRSQAASALADPQAFLQSVNLLFHDNSADNSFASLFFAMYDDLSRRLRYANCGHLAGLVIKEDGAVEHLEATGTLLGLFRPWECSLADCQLAPGDLLALYTDGVTEAYDDQEEEFGESSLIDRLRKYKSLPCREILTKIAEEVRGLNSTAQHDDITMIVAKCRY